MLLSETVIFVMLSLLTPIHKFLLVWQFCINRAATTSRMNCTRQTSHVRLAPSAVAEVSFYSTALQLLATLPLFKKLSILNQSVLITTITAMWKIRCLLTFSKTNLFQMCYFLCCIFFFEQFIALLVFKVLH